MLGGAAGALDDAVSSWFPHVRGLLAASGAQPTMFLGVRFIGHLGAAAWLIGGSWPRGGALRWVGLVTGLWLAAYTVVSPWVPPVALAPTAPLLITWCVLVGRDLSTHRG